MKLFIIKGEPILELKVPEYNILQVSFNSNKSVTLDMKSKFIVYHFGVHPFIPTY